MACRLKPQTVEARLVRKPAREGVALVGRSAQPVHFNVVLLDLVAMRVNRGLPGARLPGLGPGDAGRD